MDFPVLKGSSYVLVHTPDMIEHNGTTQTTEKITNPDSEYLKTLYDNIRSYEEVVNYPPNQTYIGNLNYKELKEIEQPWVDKPVEGKRFSETGEIMPQMEFFGLLQLCDVFELVYLETEFANEVKTALSNHKLFKEDAEKIHEGVELDWIKEQVDEHEAEGLYHDRQLVGCVVRAHEIDVNLNAQVML